MFASPRGRKQMGQLISLKCEKCGYEVNLGVGAGLTFNSLDTVLTLFDKPTQDKIKAAIEQYPRNFWYVSKEIGVCDKCGRISGVAVFKLNQENGQFIVYKAKCPCGAEVDIYDSEEVIEGKTKISCPPCGEPLEVTVNGHWD